MTCEKSLVLLLAHCNATVPDNASLRWFWRFHLGICVKQLVYLKSKDAFDCEHNSKQMYNSLPELTRHVYLFKACDNRRNFDCSPTATQQPTLIGHIHTTPSTYKTSGCRCMMRYGLPEAGVGTFTSETDGTQVSTTHGPPLLQPF